MQLKEELSVHGSDEEAEEPPEVDSDEDLTDEQDLLHGEVMFAAVSEYIRKETLNY